MRGAWMRWAVLVAAGVGALACGGSTAGAPNGSGGAAGAGNSGGSNSGGSTNAGSNSGGSTNGGSNSGGSTNGGSDSGGSNTGGGNFGGSSNFGGSTNGGSANGGTAGGACAAESFDSEQQPLDMYLMVDRSGSMEGANWAAVSSGITSFVTSPEAGGIGVGLQFFPPLNEPPCPLFAPCGVCTPALPQGCEFCDPQGFLPAAVDIAALPGVSGQIVDALNNANPSGGTPTMPALQSAAIAATTRAKQHPDRRVIIVLASDGEPSGCNTDINAIAAVAEAALLSVPSVSTFAIGIGNIAALDSIASAGGTNSAIVVGTATGGQEFVRAISQFRDEAVGCKFLLPKPSSGSPDPDKVNVQVTSQGGFAETLPRVSDATQCQGQAGWYYDDPTAPSLVLLCPASCDQVKNTDGKVSIALGCESV